MNDCFKNSKMVARAQEYIIFKIHAQIYEKETFWGSLNFLLVCPFTQLFSLSKTFLITISNHKFKYMFFAASEMIVSDSRS